MRCATFILSAAFVVASSSVRAFTVQPFASGPCTSTVTRITKLRVSVVGDVVLDEDNNDSYSTSSTSLASSVEAIDYTTASVVDYDYPPMEQTPATTTPGWSLQNPSIAFARGLILAASAVYGTNFAVVKMLDEQMPFAVSATLRFGLAAAVVSALVLQGESKHDSLEEQKERGPATLAGMEIGGWYCLGYLCQAAGLQTVDAGKSAFFNALAVIVVPLLDSMFREKQLGSKGISSVALAILGVGLLQLGPSLMEGTPLTFTQDDGYCLGLGPDRGKVGSPL